MNIIKFILAIVGLIFIGMLALWLLGFLSSIIWYLFWIAVAGGLAYGGYKLFTKVESKVLGSEKRGAIDPADIQMSWDEYDRKYLHK